MTATAEAPSEPAPTAGTLEFSADRGTLLPLVTTLSAIVPKTDANPALTQIEVVVSATGILTMTATCLTSTVIVRTKDLHTFSPGTCYIPCADFFKVLRAASPERVLVSAESGYVSVSAGSGAWRIAAAREVFFPSLPDLTTMELFGVNRSGFSTALRKAVPAVAVDGIHTALMQVDVRQSVFTACDSLRSHRVSSAFPIDASFPSHSLPGILRVLDASRHEHVYVGKTEFNSVIATPETTLITTQAAYPLTGIEGMYYLPTLAYPYSAHIPVDSLRTALNSVAVFSDDITHAVVLAFTSGKVTLTTAQDKGNAASFSLEIGWTHPAYTATVSLVHLKAALDQVSTPEAVLSMDKDTRSRRSLLVITDEAADFHAALAQLSLIKLGT